MVNSAPRRIIVTIDMVIGPGGETPPRPASSLPGGYAQAFERINGRPPTRAEREAHARMGRELLNRLPNVVWRERTHGRRG